MSRNPVIPFGFLCLLILAGACYSNLLTISILEPATVTLPSSIQRISILPLPGLYSKPGVFDSITHLLLSAGTNAKEIKMGYLHGIYDVLSVSPRFQKVVLSDTASTRFLSEGHLYWDDAVKICAHDTTDILLVLSKTVTYDAMGAPYDISEPTSYFYIDYKLLNHTKWAFYLPEKQTKLAGFEMADTILVEGLFGPADIEELLYQACYTSGRRAGTKLSPHWNEVNRFLFTGPGKEMKTATRLILNNQWNDAALIWNKLAADPKNTLASRAAHNLALAYERDDILDQAFLWIDYADSLSGNPETSAYKLKLYDRIKTRAKLDEQMAGN